MTSCMASYYFLFVSLQHLLCGGNSWFLCDSSSPTSPSGSSLDSNSDARLNSGKAVFVQAWQLLCILIPLFLPKHLVLWYLKAHLQRHADKKYDCSSLCEGIRGILHCSTVYCTCM